MILSDFHPDIAEARLILSDRLDDIEHVQSTLSDRKLRRAVHSLKGLSAAYGFKVVAGIAHALESAMAQDGRATPLTVYLDRMREALDADDPADPALLGLLLRMIDARLCHA